MTLETVLYTTKALTTEGRENGAANTDDGRLDLKLSPAAVSSILRFTAEWRRWSCVLRCRNGFGPFESLRFGLWLARGQATATPGQILWK